MDDYIEVTYKKGKLRYLERYFPYIQGVQTFCPKLFFFITFFVFYNLLTSYNLFET